MFLDASKATFPNRANTSFVDVMDRYAAVNYKLLPEELSKLQMCTKVIFSHKPSN